MKQRVENKIVEVTQTLTSEVQYLNNRLKQKLLFQIGLIDDPWIDDDEPIIDPCFSEDSQDDYGQKVFRKSNSVDKF